MSCALNRGFLSGEGALCLWSSAGLSAASLRRGWWKVMLGGREGLDWYVDQLVGKALSAWRGRLCLAL